MKSRATSPRRFPQFECGIAPNVEWRSRDRERDRVGKRDSVEIAGILPTPALLIGVGDRQPATAPATHDGERKMVPLVEIELPEDGGAVGLMREELRAVATFQPAEGERGIDVAL